MEGSNRLITLRQEYLDTHLGQPWKRLRRNLEKTGVRAVKQHASSSSMHAPLVPRSGWGTRRGVSRKTAPISGGGRIYGTRSLARLKGGAEGVDRRTARSDVGSTHNTNGMYQRLGGGRVGVSDELTTEDKCYACACLCLLFTYRNKTTLGTIRTIIKRIPKYSLPNGSY